ncbi:MAG: hypothetical protein IT463_09230 [Planctomycetes bacterium]|nr:hypothetical protein [Planctomycetota bacterium]
MGNARPAAPRPAGSIAPAQGGGVRPYGQQAAEGAAPASGPRGINVFLVVGGAAMLLGFVLPWISIDIIIFKLSWSGAELPFKLNEAMDQMMGVLGDSADAETKSKLDSIRSTMSSLYAVYLIPVLCVAALVDEFLAFKKGRNRWWMRALAAASPILAYIVVYIAFVALAEKLGLGGDKTPAKPDKDTPSMFSVLGVGAYVSLLGFLATTASVFLCPKRKKAAAPLAPRRPGPAPGGRRLVQPQHAAAQTATPALSPRTAALQLLALCAGLEEPLAASRLAKARAAAGKLFGGAAQAEIASGLSQPRQPQDFAAEATELAATVQTDPRLPANVLKCAAYSLKDGDGTMSPQAQQAMRVLQGTLQTAPAAAAPVPAAASSRPQRAAPVAGPKPARPGLPTPRKRPM